MPNEADSRTRSIVVLAPDPGAREEILTGLRALESGGSTVFVVAADSVADLGALAANGVPRPHLAIVEMGSAAAAADCVADLRLWDSTRAIPVLALVDPRAGEDLTPLRAHANALLDLAAAGGRSGAVRLAARFWLRHNKVPPL